MDNDGWLDFYLGTGNPDLAMLIPNRMFRNAEGKFFQDVTSSGGFGHLQKGHGVAFADFDHDGDQDVFENMGGAYTGDIYRNVLFRNPGHGNHWITIQARGVESNRSAIGTRITVTVQTQEGSTRTIYRTVRSGGSFGSSPLRQQIGIGNARSIKRVEIFWPATGKRQVLEGLAMDRFYSVTEGSEGSKLITVKRFTLGDSQHAHHP